MFRRRKARAGRYAENRYQAGLRSWRAKNRRNFLVLLGPLFAAGVAVGVLGGELIPWAAGVAVGVSLTLWLVFRDTPPRYIEQWADGAEGERRAERALASLERTGWTVTHDVQNGHGNYDHIVVGPAGVFLLDSKNLQGIVGVRSGVPHLSRRHDPDAGQARGWIPRRALGDAARLHQQIRRRTGRSPWVHAVVVFWSEFPEGFVEHDSCVYIEGARVCAWLESLPSQLSPAEVEAIAAGVRGIAEEAGAGDDEELRSELSPA
jgi:hypothetical protein